MAGHSKWSKIKRDKGANDAKRGAIFTKLGNQIALAARAGADPDMNPALALAIDKAKSANMPNANIERSIARVADKNAKTLEEVTYEGMGPGGIGLMIEVATDNKNRTLPEIKTALIKNGGRLADAGSVAFQFSRKGVIVVDGADEVTLLAILESGAEDAKEDDGETIVYTDAKDLMKVRDNLKASGLGLKDAELAYVPNTIVQISDDEIVSKCMKLLDVLDDLSDVVNIHTNAEL